MCVCLCVCFFQPDDRGCVDGVQVLRVIRKGGEAIHYLESALEAGMTVSQKICWQRRHDHMQQHSAQHLISGMIYFCIFIDAVSV